MATVQLRLSSKTDANGRSQVIVKLTVSRSNRPCFKSGVFVNPEWFKAVAETKKGAVYGIIVPKRGKLNILQVREAEAQKAALDSYIGRLTAVCNALCASNCGSEPGHDAIEEAMNVTMEVPAGSITYQVISDALRSGKEDNEKRTEAKTFFEWMEYYITKQNVTEGRKRSFHVLIRMLSRYQSFVRLTDRSRKRFTLDVGTFDKETAEDFFDYMANEKALSEEYSGFFKRILSEYPAELSPKHKTSQIVERGRNILVERKKQLRAFFRWLDQQEGVTTCRPFANIKIGVQTFGTPYYLSLEERNLIADKPLEDKHLSTQRDIFVFQCLIGCRYSDLQKLTSGNLTNRGGIVAVEYIPKKTKGKNPTVVSVPLNSRAMALVEKYKDKDAKGRLFPFISSQKYNYTIKDILEKCEINRKVQVINSKTGDTEYRLLSEVASSHMARRTFIGNLYKKVKDPNLIGSMSGHAEGSRAFCRYRTVDLEIKRDTVSLID